MDFSYTFLVEKLVDIGRATLENHSAVSPKNELASRDLAIPFLHEHERKAYVPQEKN